MTRSLMTDEEYIHGIRSFSISELEEALNSIDGERFPLRHEALKNEISARYKDPSSEEVKKHQELRKAQDAKVVGFLIACLIMAMIYAAYVEAGRNFISYALDGVLTEPFPFLLINAALVGIVIAWVSISGTRMRWGRAHWIALLMYLFGLNYIAMETVPYYYTKYNGTNEVVPGFVGEIQKARGRRNYCDRYAMIQLRDEGDFFKVCLDIWDWDDVKENRPAEFEYRTSKYGSILIKIHQEGEPKGSAPSPKSSIPENPVEKGLLPEVEEFRKIGPAAEDRPYKPGTPASN